jgi:hypothetical protein
VNAVGSSGPTARKYTAVFKTAEELAKQLAAQELLETVEDRVALSEDDLSELVSLVETWNELAATLRAGILAMVRSSV